VRHCGAGKTLEGGRRWVDAQRDPVAIDLVQNEPVQFVLDLVDARQVSLPVVAEGAFRFRLEVARVLADAGGGGGDAAAAHAGVIAQSTLVQVGMVERLHHSDPLLRIERQHLAEEVDRLVSGGLAEGVQGGDGGRLLAPREHVSLGGLAGELHVGERGGAQEVGDKLELLDGGLSLEEDAAAQQFAEDAADAPHVHSRRVVLGAHQDLRRAVVLRHHLLRHVARTVRLLNSCQTKVADFEHTV